MNFQILKVATEGGREGLEHELTNSLHWKENKKDGTVLGSAAWANFFQHRQPPLTRLRRTIQKVVYISADLLPRRRLVCRWTTSQPDFDPVVQRRPIAGSFGGCVGPVLRYGDRWWWWRRRSGRKLMRESASWAERAWARRSKLLANPFLFTNKLNI